MKAVLIGAASAGLWAQSPRASELREFLKETGARLWVFGQFKNVADALRRRGLKTVLEWKGDRFPRGACVEALLKRGSEKKELLRACSRMRGFDRGLPESHSEGVARAQEQESGLARWGIDASAGLKCSEIWLINPMMADSVKWIWDMPSARGESLARLNIITQGGEASEMLWAGWLLAAQRLGAGSAAGKVWGVREWDQLMEARKTEGALRKAALSPKKKARKKQKNRV